MLRCGGLNVSRALGDRYLTEFSPFPVVSHKPKITVHQLQSKDTLILACDGLKDYVPEQEIVQEVTKAPSIQNLAQRLVRHAIEEKKALDNVTVLALKVE